MAESKTSSATTTTPSVTTSRSSWPGLLLLVVVPVTVAILLFRSEEFDPAPLPDHALSRASKVPHKHSRRVLEVAVRVGDGLLPGPEDFAYDAGSKLIYTGCSDGWIRKVNVTESAKKATVENWAYGGGRPLGLAFGPDEQLIVADAYKGLLKVSSEGVVQLLTEEAEGLKFGCTDGVDVARDGMIHFTDASYKYNLKDHRMDFLEGRPHGRLMSFDPSINWTQVLTRDLYFANGVALSPDQDFLVFCETILQRCSKYHIQGEKKGSTENFIDNLPGFPDNIRYDGEGHYWIALFTAKTFFWDILLRYPFMRKTVSILGKYVTLPSMQRDGGVLAVNMDGEGIALYSDPGLSMVTGGIKIGKHLYLGSLVNSYIITVDLNL